METPGETLGERLGRGYWMEMRRETTGEGDYGLPLLHLPKGISVRVQRNVLRVSVEWGST